MAKIDTVINNYFDIECDIDTTIREAYRLGFLKGYEKACPLGNTKQQGTKIYRQETIDAISRRWENQPYFEGSGREIASETIRVIESVPPTKKVVSSTAELCEKLKK